MGGSIVFQTHDKQGQPTTMREAMSRILGRPIPDEELISRSFREVELLVASLREENEMLQEELDYLKGYPVNG